MRDRRSLVLVAEVGLCHVTLAAVIGMWRLFVGGEWVAPLLANAVVAHVTVTVLRRRGASLPVTAIAMVGVAAVTITWAVYWSTTAIGLPTGETWTQLDADIRAAWSLFQDVSPPAEVATGFLVATSVAIWFIAYVADWAAFRLWVPFEASLPAGTLFLFTAILGTTSGRYVATALYALVLVMFLLLHRLARQDGASHWITDRPEQGHRFLVTAGSGLTAVAVLLGVVLAPALPGASEPPVIPLRDLASPDKSRVTISPLVDIRSRLIEQSDIEVFTVRSPQRSYWRLTSLDRFDGQIWSSSGSYPEANGTLPVPEDLEIATETFDQTYTITALADIWLPNAYQPRALALEGVPIRFDEDSSTLIVDNDIENSDSLVYRITSESPRFTAEELAQDVGEVPSDIADRYTDLPDDFPSSVRALARDLTEGASTTAEKALALQDHLRTFEYDLLSVEEGHSDSALVGFLFDTKRGYCEQFAGSFAAMARSIGIPARVAVGFTPGEEDPTERGVFHVRGLHAHAWPEVYIAGAGWVAYEPTPGRGMPNAESYTGVRESQSSGTGGPPVTGPSTTTPTTSPFPGSTIDPRPQGGELDSLAEPDQAVDEGSGSFEAVLRWLGTLALVALGVLVAYLVVFPGGGALRRWRRRRAATTARDHIDLAWAEASESAELVGYREVRSDTFPARAERLARLLPSAGTAPDELAHLIEHATYSAEGADEGDVAVAQAAGTAIVSAAHAATTWKTRAWANLDPRPVVRGWLSDRRDRTRRITQSARGDLEQERELVDAGELR